MTQDQIVQICRGVFAYPSCNYAKDFIECMRDQRSSSDTNSTADSLEQNKTPGALTDYFNDIGSYDN